MTVTSASTPSHVHAPQEQEQEEDLAAWSCNTTCSFNGQVLSISGSLGYEGNDLFRDAHIVLERSSVYGLVAPNGSGKTSLVRAIPTAPDFPDAAKFAYEYTSADIAKQSHEETDALLHRSARDYCLTRMEERVHKMDEEIERLEGELETLEDAEQIESVSNELGNLYELKDDLQLDAESKVAQMFCELQFGEEYPHMPFSNLSSGWKFKCELISSFLTQPDCLVIDEPSFLDTAATAWFVDQVRHLSKSLNRIVVLISHKEELMEELCDRIIYINPASQNVTIYNSSFRQFQAAHSERVTRAQKSKDQAQTEHKKAKSSLSNLKQQLHKREKNLKGTTSKNADQRFIKGKNKEAKQKADHSAAAKVKRMQTKAATMSEEQESWLEVRLMPLDLKGSSSCADSGRPILELVNVSFQYEGSRDILLHDVCGQVHGRDRILLRGENGQGKSTLAKLLLGELEPTKGTIRKHHLGRVAHFHQDALFELVHYSGNVTAVDFLLSTRKEHNKNLSLVAARQHLGRFGLKGTLALRPIKTLSAGQRTRLWLAREFLSDDNNDNGSDGDGNKPSLLVLDEVTENLDRPTVGSLLSSLERFEAAIVAISHDEFFAAGFEATQNWWLRGGHLVTEYL